MQHRPGDIVSNSVSPLGAETVVRVGNALAYLSRKLDEIASAWARLQKSTQATTAYPEIRDFFGSLPWVHYYGLPPLPGLILMIAVSGATSASDRIARQLLGFLPVASQPLLRSAWTRLNLRLSAPAVTAAKRSLDSMVVHHAVMSTLIRRVGSADPEDADEAFFQALGVDPGALLSGPMRRRFRRAVITQDSDFLAKVGGKLAEPIVPEHLRNTGRLQVAFFLLAHIGALYRITTADMAYELFVTRGRLYPGERAKVGAKDNLWRLVRNAQNEYRKEIPEEFSSLSERLVNMVLLRVPTTEQTDEQPSQTRTNRPRPERGRSK